jgi:hypothetical protein
MPTTVKREAIRLGNGVCSNGTAEAGRRTQEEEEAAAAAAAAEEEAEEAGFGGVQVTWK